MKLNTNDIAKIISQDLLAIVRRNFEVEGRPKWKPLSPAYKRRRYKKGYTGNILTVSGQLLKSIVAQTENNTAIVSTNKVYAPIHNFGGTINMPARSNLYTQNRIKRGKNKGKFTKRTTYGKGATIKAHKIVIPKREFMNIPDNELSKLLKKVKTLVANNIDFAK